MSDMDIPAEIREELMEVAKRNDLSYVWLCSVYQRGVENGGSVLVGPTGQFPYGKLDPHDEGELTVAIAADHRHGVVRLEFGKQVTWLALPAAHVRQLAGALITKAEELEQHTH